MLTIHACRQAPDRRAQSSGWPPRDTETRGKNLSDACDQGVAIDGPYAFMTMPGLFIVFVVLGFTFIGYAMYEVLSPKLRRDDPR